MTSFLSRLSRDGGPLTALAFALALLLFAHPFAAHAEPCPPELVAVDLGNLELTFADNGDGSFTGSGLAGTLHADSQGLSMLLDGTGEAANAIDLRLAFEGAETALLPAEGAQGTSIVRLGDGAALPPVATATALESRGLYPGVDLTVRGTGRRIWLELDASGADAVSAIRLSAPGAGLGLADETTLTVSADVIGTGSDGIAFGQRRGIELELVVLDVVAGKERKIDGRLTLQNGIVGVQLAEPPSGTVRVLLTALLAPYSGADDTERLPSGSMVALSTVRAEAGSTRRQAVITELDGEGSRVLSTTLVDLGDDFDANGLAVDASGQVLLAGRRHLAAGPKGEESISIPYVATVDPVRGALVPSPAFEGLEGEIHDVLVDPNGTVRVVGLAGNGFQATQGELADFTLALPYLEEATPDRLFVAELSPALDRISSSLELAVPVSEARLRIWIDCHGKLHIGLPWWVNQLTSVDHTYSISETGSQFATCPRIQDAIGFVLLCWKALRIAPDWTYHPNNVSVSDVPSSLIYIKDPTDPNAPGTSDHVRMNQLEANQHGNLFYDTTTSQWADPGGSWTHPNNFAYSKVELALAAALYHERWGSPIGANLRVPTDLDPPGVRAVMIREETFSADSTAELPHNICDEDSDNDGVSDFGSDPWPTVPENEVSTACANAHGSSFTLESIKYDTVRNGAAYIPNQTLSGSDSSWWPWYTAYIGDPPVLDDNEPGMRNVHLREMSQRLSETARIPVTVQVIQVNGGMASAPTYQSGEVSASALN